MARLTRAVAIGFPHHVTHRGNNRCDVFLCDEDRQTYLDFLCVYSAQAQLDIWGYCLMSNHVHLIVVPRAADSLARGVGLAHRRYAVWLNQRAGYSGHLWANRFFSTALDEAHHWMAIRYVERNPVRAGLVVKAEQYPWSSACAHVLGKEDALLSANRPYPGPVADWGAWLQDPAAESDGIEALRRCTQTGRPCGSMAFAEMLEQMLGRRLRPQKRGPKVEQGDEDAEGQKDLFAV